MEESERLDSEECNYIASFVDGLCHLLKKSGELLTSSLCLRFLPWSKDTMCCMIRNLKFELCCHVLFVYIVFSYFLFFFFV